jgi:hypothetical protein
MKFLPLFILLSSFSALVCATAATPPDGFYLEDGTRKSPLQVSAKDMQGKTHVVRVLEYTNLAPSTIVVYSLAPHESAFQVQVNLTSPDDSWLKLPLILVVEGKPYLEISKSGSRANSSAGVVNTVSTVTLKTQTEPEAVHIKKRLEARFGLSHK